MLHDARVANLLAERKERPADRDLLLELARAHNVRSMPDEAREACEAILQLAPEDGEAWFEAVMARSFGGPEQLEALRPDLERLARKRPNEDWPHRNLGLLEYYLEHDEPARAACEKALAADPTDSHAHEVLAYLAYTVGDLDGAVESGIKAVEADPRNFRALHWLGECYVKLDAAPQAIRYFHRALRIEDSYFFALESLGKLYLREESTFPEAVQCFGKILSINPRYFPVHFNLADAYIQADRLTEAAAQAEAVLHLAPDRAAEADAHQYLGVIALMDGRRDIARSHFERALALDARFAAAHHYLGSVAEQEGDGAAAEASYRKAIGCDPLYALPHVRLGYISFDRKEYENARRHFQAALDIDAEEYMAHLGLGEIARWRRDYDAQLEHCRTAAELSPDDSNVRNQLGTALDALGRVPEAAVEYEAALKLDPYNRQAANNLGYLYERHLKEASPREAPGVREKAIGAWKRRLLICRDSRLSVRGARSHLEKLGVPPNQVDDWLAHGQVA